MTSTPIPFKGKQRSMHNPAKWRTSAHHFLVNVNCIVRDIPAGSEVMQFETINFGWTVWTNPDGSKHLDRQ